MDNNHKWTSSKGKEQMISEMPTTYIENCVNVMDRDGLERVIPTDADGGNRTIDLSGKYDRMKLELRLRALEPTSE